MRILIATPIYDEQVMVSYHTSIVRLLLAFGRRRPDVAFDHRLQGTAVISHARNAAATLLLADKRYSHLLFIDGDMGFQPSLIERMLAFDQPVVGCIAPKRRLNYPALATALREVEDPTEARFLAQEYINHPGDFVVGPDGEHFIREGFVRVLRTGTGVMLLKRHVVEQLSEAFPELWADGLQGDYESLGVLGGRVFQPFAENWQAAGGLYVSEDFAFCSRWVQGCGGEIWACADETITHVGRERYIGNYLAGHRHETR
jgi:hypothetical protein